MPGRRPFQLVGHRGAREEAPENTIPGFVYARALGLQAVELDVHLTRDGQLAVIHDGTVDRTTDATGPVGEFTMAELAALDARAAHPAWPERVGVPTLDQALDALDDVETIQIEIKRDDDARMEQVVAAVLGVVAKRDLAFRVIVSSFEPTAVEAVQHLAPDQRRAYIGAYDDPSFVHTALELGCTQADMSLNATSAEMVDLAQREGLRVVGYQCNSAEALYRCLEWGVDAATSDVPSTILPLLARAEAEARRPTQG